MSADADGRGGKQCVQRRVGNAMGGMLWGDYIMLGLLNTIKAYNSTGSSLVRELEEENLRSESFFKEVENWRNVEQNYIAKVAQVAASLRDRAARAHPHPTDPPLHPDPAFCANSELAKLLQVVMDNHKSFLSKINYDVFLVNCDSAEKLLSESRKLLEEEKQQQREIGQRREQLEKVLGKREKLRRAKEEEEMLQIFLLDSVDSTIDQKIRKKNRIKEIEKEAEEFEVKVKETFEDYSRLVDRNRDSLARTKHNFHEQARCKTETLLKLSLHLSTYWRNLQAGLEEYDREAHYRTAEPPPLPLFARMERKEDEVGRRLAAGRAGFVETSLRLINDNAIEELLEYSRDREVKTRIKRMMETDEVNPEETDEVSRQVKLVKKMLVQEEVDVRCVEVFRALINKSSRLRMNFVFILQFFRINSQFEIAPPRIQCLHCLISEFLQAAHLHRDSFVLKQLMILLMTYFVTHRPREGAAEKIYIIHFFKKDPLWRDIEYWESVLLECIYLEKRNTLAMMINSEMGNLSRKKELLEAERLAILNQMLMVVRNMVIFEFTEKEVKAFALRFIKMLRQDEKFQKDVLSTIEDAVKEENKLLLEQRDAIKDYYLNHLARAASDSPEEYSIPEEIRKSYTG